MGDLSDWLTIAIFLMTAMIFSKITHLHLYNIQVEKIRGDLSDWLAIATFPMTAMILVKSLIYTCTIFR
jgi:hypothetical protein